MKGRLNLFQTGMLRWRDLAPYNAVHALRLDAPLDRPRLQRAIEDTLGTFGLTGFELDRARGRYEYRGGAGGATLEIISGGTDPAEALRAEIERQINTPFPPTGSYEPFRFFVVDMGSSFHLGLAYDHFIAAGDSIIGLLVALVDSYRHESTAAGRRPPPGLYPAPYRRMLFRRAFALLRGLAGLPAMVGSVRRAFRPRYPHGRDMGNAFVQFRIERAGLDGMRRAAKAWGLSLHDLLLAMVLLALSPLAEARREAPRRRELAVAAIVNVRADCGHAAAAAFGQFLSSFLVAHPVPPDITLERLARDVHAETARVRRGKLYLQTLLAMGLGGLIWRLLSPPARARFLAKSYPVWAGTTSLNADPLWTAAGGEPPAEYLRAASTGPQAPLVAVLTGTGSALHVGLSYRTAAFTREEVGRIRAGILRCVDALAR